MTKKILISTDNIDIILLFNIFWAHKKKYILLPTIGLIFSTFLTDRQIPKYETEFKAIVEQTPYNYINLRQTPKIKVLLNESLLNKNQLPNYSYSIRDETYTVKSDSKDVKKIVVKNFKIAVKTHIQDMKKVNAHKFEYKGALIDFNNFEQIMAYQVSDDVNPDDIAESLTVSFGKTHQTYPSRMKNGIIWVSVGLATAFFWMMISLIYNVNRKQK